MEYSEDSVFEQQESAPAEAQAPETSDDGVTTLSELLGGSAEEASQGQTAEATEVQQETQQTETVDQTVKGSSGSVDTDLKRLVEEAKAEIRAEYEEKYGPLREMTLAREADELVASGEFKSKDRALEYLKLKQGIQPPPTAAQERQRDAQGRYISKEQIDADAKRRADDLMQQHETILAMGGPDTLDLVSKNPKVKEKVVRGEWTLVDVAKAWQAEQERKQKHTPAPVRNPNHSVTGRSVADMSDDELERITQRARQGFKIDLRR